MHLNETDCGKRRVLRDILFYGRILVEKCKHASLKKFTAIVISLSVHHISSNEKYIRHKRRIGWIRWASLPPTIYKMLYFLVLININILSFFF